MVDPTKVKPRFFRPLLMASLCSVRAGTGRVTAQHADYENNIHGFDAAYTWDNEGRMTGINYGPQYTMTYDANGRLGGMSGSDLSASASYGVAGETLRSSCCTWH